jgi:hypothetical protein
VVSAQAMSDAQNQQPEYPDFLRPIGVPSKKRRMHADSAGDQPDDDDDSLTVMLEAMLDNDEQALMRDIQAMVHDDEMHIEAEVADAEGCDDDAATVSDGSDSVASLVAEVAEADPPAAWPRESSSSSSDGDDVGRDAPHMPAGIALQTPITIAEVVEFRSQALRDSRASHSPSDMCTHLGIEVDGMHVVDRWAVGAPRQVAKVQPCFKGSTMCAQCLLHPRCKFLLSVKPLLGLTILEVQADVLSWVAAGIHMSEAQHFELQNHVKRRYYGMRIR